MTTILRTEVRDNASDELYYFLESETTWLPMLPEEMFFNGIDFYKVAGRVFESEGAVLKIYVRRVGA